MKPFLKFDFGDVNSKVYFFHSFCYFDYFDFDDFDDCGHWQTFHESKLGLGCKVNDHEK